MRFAFNIYIYIMRILPHVQTVKLYILHIHFIRVFSPEICSSFSRLSDRHCPYFYPGVCYEKYPGVCYEKVFYLI